MAIVKHAIGENDFIGLRGTVGRWPTGTTGTVVSDYGPVKLVEISNERGETLDLIQVPEPQLKRISKHNA